MHENKFGFAFHPNTGVLDANPIAESVYGCGVEDFEMGGTARLALVTVD